MTINRKTLMHFAQCLPGETPTEQEIRQIVWKYLETIYEPEVARRYPMWPKEIKDMCSAVGIVQDQDTGLPDIDTRSANNWASRAHIAESVSAALKHDIVEMAKELESYRAKQCATIH